MQRSTPVAVHAPPRCPLATLVPALLTVGCGGLGTG